LPQLVKGTRVFKEFPLEFCGDRIPTHDHGRPKMPRGVFSAAGSTCRD